MQGLEIYCKENVKSSIRHLFVCFKSPADRSDFYQQLLQQKGSMIFCAASIFFAINAPVIIKSSRVSESPLLLIDFKLKLTI